MPRPYTWLDDAAVNVGRRSRRHQRRGLRIPRVDESARGQTMRSPRDERQQAILAAARDLFSRQGYHGTSMPEIARAADVSVGLIYHVFASKEELLAEIVEDTHAVHLAVFDTCADIADPLARF